MHPCLRSNLCLYSNRTGATTPQVGYDIAVYSQLFLLSLVEILKSSSHLTYQDTQNFLSSYLSRYSELPLISFVEISRTFLVFLFGSRFCGSMFFLVLPLRSDLFPQRVCFYRYCVVVLLQISCWLITRILSSSRARPYVQFETPLIEAFEYK